MRIRVALLALSMLLLIPAAAQASLADEQRQGGDLIAQLQAGTKNCRHLSADDFDDIGEYMMAARRGRPSLRSCGSFIAFALRLGIEDRVTPLPSHIDTTVNLHDALHAQRNGHLEAIWAVSARGKVQ